MNIKVSVVCTVYNDQNEIEKMLDDISNQTLLPNEIVIADGGSKDNTIKIVNDYKEKSGIDINLIYGARLNISQGFNTAIKKSQNDIIVIMSTGNRYDKNFIKELVEKFSETNADIVFAPIRGNENSKFSILYNKAFLKNKYGNRIPSNHGVLIKKEVFKKIGLFYENFIYAGEDAEFFERAKKSNLNIECAEQAKLEWDVPNSLKDFKKQIRNYTIAKMQIESFKIFKNYKRDYLTLLILIAILILIIIKQYHIAIILISMFIVFLLCNCLKNGIKTFIIKQYRNWYEIKIIIFNLNKLNKKYKVNKELIEKF